MVWRKKESSFLRWSRLLCDKLLSLKRKIWCWVTLPFEGFKPMTFWKAHSCYGVAILVGFCISPISLILQASSRCPQGDPSVVIKNTVSVTGKLTKKASLTVLCTRTTWESNFYIKGLLEKSELQRHSRYQTMYSPAIGEAFLSSLANFKLACFTP